MSHTINYLKTCPFLKFVFIFRLLYYACIYFVFSLFLSLKSQNVYLTFTIFVLQISTEYNSNCECICFLVSRNDCPRFLQVLPCRMGKRTPNIRKCKEIIHFVGWSVGWLVFHFLHGLGLQPPNMLGAVSVAAVGSCRSQNVKGLETS